MKKKQYSRSTFLNKLKLLQEYLDVDSEYEKEREEVNPYKKKKRKVVKKKKTDWRNRFDEV